MGNDNPQYIHSNQSNTIFKYNIMPRAGKERLGDFGIYAGETTDNYTHGYLYECVLGQSHYDLIDFEPAKIGFDYTKGYLEVFFADLTEDYDDLVSGSMKFLKAGNIWAIDGKDKDGKVLFEDYKLYTEDLEDAGFVFTFPPDHYLDEEVINYTVNHNIVNEYKWQRVEL